jgi:hypothetical protein
MPFCQAAREGSGRKALITPDGAGPWAIFVFFIFVFYFYWLLVSKGSVVSAME